MSDSIFPQSFSLVIKDGKVVSELEFEHWEIYGEDTPETNQPEEQHTSFEAFPKV